MPDTFIAVASKLIENEMAIGRLYELFAATFAPDAGLWTGLAEDEGQHAEWIRRAAEVLTPEQRGKSLLSIRLAAIENMTQYVESIGARCRRGELTRINALALAHDLENSLLESRLLATLSSGAARLAGLEQSLVESTAKHRNTLAEALDRLRRAG